MLKFLPPPKKTNSCNAEKTLQLTLECIFNCLFYYFAKLARR